MKKLIFASCIGLLAGCTMNDPGEMRAAAGDDEARLASALEGYEQAGPSVSCVAQRYLRGNRSAGEGAIIFDDQSPNKIWVNRPPAGCPSLEPGRALITKTPSDRLCRGDIARVSDLVSGIEYGGCGLGDFTPYRRRG